MVLVDLVMRETLLEPLQEDGQETLLLSQSEDKELQVFLKMTQE